MLGFLALVPSRCWSKEHAGRGRITNAGNIDLRYRPIEATFSRRHRREVDETNKKRSEAVMAPDSKTGAS